VQARHSPIVHGAFVQVVTSVQWRVASHDWTVSFEQRFAVPGTHSPGQSSPLVQTGASPIVAASGPSESPSVDASDPVSVGASWLSRDEHAVVASTPDETRATRDRHMKRRERLKVMSS
jgi:hypothetical protein